MIIFEMEKEDIKYVDRIGELADMCIVIDNPKSFSSELNTVVQIGVELAPYAISGVTLIIIELIKNRKKIKIKVSDNGFEVEGDEEKALKIAKELIEQKQEGAQAVVLALGTASRTILTKEERCRILEEMGVDILLECPLTEKIRHMKAENFIKEILIGDLQVSYVAVGEDFRFGYERKGTPAMLKEFGKKYGFHTEVLPKKMDGRRKISSTFVREELNRGNMEKFRFLMGTDFSVEGIVEHGRGMGHKYLLPTTNLIPPVEKLMPPNGVYITVSHFRDRSYQGITNVGHKPTVGGEKFIGVETYLFDCNEDLYGEYCKVDFKKFLRPEQKFSSLEALKAQLERDAVKGQEYFETL